MEKFPNWNPYNYVMQNPINLIDPTGMSTSGPGDDFDTIEEAAKDSDAIFIDDSFKERKDVSSKLGIPCFSVDMIRGLCCLQS